MLTDAGVQGSGKRWFGRAAYDEARAANVFRQALGNSARRPFKMKKNPYFLVQSQQYYKSPQTGLGADDYDADMAERIGEYDSRIVATAPGLAPQPTGGSSSGWMDVLQSITRPLATGVGVGLTNLIGGRPSTVVQAAPSGPSLTSVLLIGGGLLAGTYLLMRRR